MYVCMYSSSSPCHSASPSSSDSPEWDWKHSWSTSDRASPSCTGADCPPFSGTCQYPKVFKIGAYQHGPQNIRLTPTPTPTHTHTHTHRHSLTHKLAKVERNQSLSVNLPPQPGGCQDLKQGTITHSNIKDAHEGVLTNWAWSDKQGSTPIRDWPLNGFPVLSTNAVTRSMHYTHTSCSFAPPHARARRKTHLQTCTASRHYHLYTKFADSCGYWRPRSCSFGRARVSSGRAICADDFKAIHAR